MKLIAILFVCLTLLMNVQCQLQVPKTGAISETKAKSDSDVDADTNNGAYGNADANGDANGDDGADADADSNSDTNFIPDTNFIANANPDSVFGLGPGLVPGIAGVPSSTMIFSTIVKMITEFLSKIKAEIYQFLNSSQLKALNAKKHDIINKFTREFIQMLQFGINLMKYNLCGPDKSKEYQQSNKSRNFGNDGNPENHGSPDSSNNSGNGGYSNSYAESNSNSKAFSSVNQQKDSNDHNDSKGSESSGAASASAVST